MDDFWRSRAGVPRSRGVLAPHPGEPSLAAAEPGSAPTSAAPIRMTRLPPATALAGFVRHYWIPRWRLPAGRSVTQRVLEYPSANLVLELGDVAVHGPSIGLGTRTLTGAGRAFGVLLQPGVASALLGVDARSLVGTALPLAGAPRLSGPRDAAAIAAMCGAVERSLDAVDDGGPGDEGRAADDRDAVAAFEHWLTGLDLALPDDARLVRELVTRAEDDRTLVRVEHLARLAGMSVRHLERIVREQLGLTPRWLIRRYRLQEAAERLAAPDRPTLAGLAAELGYADQAHFTREFSAVIGVPPGRYLRQAGRAGAGVVQGTAGGADGSGSAPGPSGGRS